MYFYIKNITKVKKGEVLSPFSKTPPENSYLHLCDDELRSTNNYKKRRKC